MINSHLTCMHCRRWNNASPQKSAPVKKVGEMFGS